MMMAGVTEIGAAAAALATADRVGIIAQLCDGPCSLASLAEQLGLDASKTELLLDVLESIDAVQRGEGGGYEIGPLLRRNVEIRAGKPGALFSLWAGTEHLVRQGKPATPMRDTTERMQTYANVTPLLERMVKLAARRLAAIIEQRSPQNVLDVGTGSGVWGLAMLDVAPYARLTAVDLPLVIDRFWERAEQRMLAGRCESIAGDYHEVPLPHRAFDLVLLGGVLHLEAPDRARALLRRLRPTLTADGALVIVDIFADDSPRLRRACAAYALHLALRVPGGRPHPEPQLRQWLEDLGLGAIERFDLDPFGPPGMAALIATPGRQDRERSSLDELGREENA